MKKMVMLFIFGFLFLLTSFAGENRALEQERLEACRLLTELLIQNKYCTSESECVKKQMTFCSPAKEGISIQMWGLDHRITDAASQKILKLFLAEKKIKSIDLRIYSTSKQQSLEIPFWKKISAIFEINLKRGEE